MRKPLPLAGAALSLAFSVPAVAQTTQVNFSLNHGSTTIGSGLFSYDATLSGVLGYDDLNTFQLNLPEHSYDLAFVESGGFHTEWHYFGYSTSMGRFVPEDPGNYELLSAIKSNGFTSGFFIGCGFSGNGTQGCINDYADAKGDLAFNNIQYASSTIASGVPEPSTWAMLLLGFGAVGGAMRTGKRRQKVTVSYA